MSKVMRKKVASILTTAMVVGSTPLVGYASEVSNVPEIGAKLSLSQETQVPMTTSAAIKVLGMDNLKNETLKADKICGDFTIKATSDNTVVIDSNPQTSEYHHNFTKRLKLGGAGNATYRSVEFTTTGPADVALYATSNGSDDRLIYICDQEGNKVAELNAYSLATITEKDKDKKLPAQIAHLDVAGTYYIYSETSVNLYYASVIEGEVTAPTFEDGTKPEVLKMSNNTYDETRVDIVVKGTIANPDTDRLWVKLYDASGDLVASDKISELTDGQDTVTLSPGKSGNYKVVCDAIRAGVKEAISSEPFEQAFNIPLGSVSFTNVKTGKDNALNVDWDDTRSAISYDVYIQEEEKEEIEVANAITKSEYSIPDLTPGVKYTVRVVARDAANDVVEASYEKVLAQKEERFMSAAVGSAASGYITENEDGSVKIQAIPVGTGSGGKLADSEDGFMYYYTEIDPKTENFTLTATFHVDDSASKDNQSGFGVMAVDTFEAGNSSARYFNSAGSMLRKYINAATGASIMGAPGGYYVTGYTGESTTSSSSRTTIDTAPFDWNYKSDYVEGTNTNPPRFQDGEEYTLTLRKSNTGFHASMIDPRTGEKTEEVICYEPDLLLQQDKDKYYVGFAVSRKITVTVKDIRFTTIKPEDDEAKKERPTDKKVPSFFLNSTTTTGVGNYEAGFMAGYAGKIDVIDSKGNVVAKDVTVDPRNVDTVRAVAQLQLNKGLNTYKAIYTPFPKAEQGELLGQYEELTSYEPIEIDFTVDYKTYGTEANAIYASPTGTTTGEGTKAKPLDVYTAVSYAQPGQEIVLLGGTYKLSQGININRGQNGTAEKPIILMSAPNQRAVLDFAGCSDTGITMGGDYWHVYDMEVKNAGKFGVHITGNHNIAEKLTVHSSGSTGVQMSGSMLETYEMWPSYNLVQSTESYNNCDASANDANGFAATITVGDGNVFRYCISHHNIDDGWDLYAKSTTGVIGEVLIEKSVTYANGKLTTGNLVGAGNGFKLGGENVSVAHVLRDSISFDNMANGVFSNSNPSCITQNTISVNNGRNLYLNTNAARTTWELNDFISYKGSTEDEIGYKNQASIENEMTFVNGKNTKGQQVADDWFENLNTAACVPTIAADGSIDMGDFLKLTSKAPAGVGTIFGANPNPTVIQIGTEISSNTSGGSTGDSSTSGSSGGGGSTTPSTGIDESKQAIESAIATHTTPTLEVDKNGQLALNKNAVQVLLEKQADLCVTSNGTSVVINNPLLNELLGQEAATITIQVTPTSQEDYIALQTEINKASGLTLVGNKETTMTISVKTNKVVEKFTEPATVTVDLSKVNVKDPSKLTLVRYDVLEDGTVKVTKLGGAYDAKAQTLTARIDQAGNFAVVEADELLKINMTIGDKTSVVNDSSLVNDIAPQIINGRTMVPVRFIAENLGAEVNWDHKSKQVIITLNEEAITVTATEGMLIKDSRTLVPIRYISEQLNANVLWVPSQKAIEIVK